MTNDFRLFEIGTEDVIVEIESTLKFRRRTTNLVPALETVRGRLPALLPLRHLRRPSSSSSLLWCLLWY